VRKWLEELMVLQVDVQLNVERAIKLAFLQTVFAMFTYYIASILQRQHQVDVAWHGKQSLHY